MLSVMKIAMRLWVRTSDIKEVKNCYIQLILHREPDLIMIEAWIKGQVKRCELPLFSHTFFS